MHEYFISLTICFRKKWSGLATLVESSFPCGPLLSVKTPKGIRRRKISGFVLPERKRSRK
jgi:hypothetical protein